MTVLDEDRETVSKKGRDSPETRHWLSNQISGRLRDRRKE